MVEKKFNSPKGRNPRIGNRDNRGDRMRSKKQLESLALPQIRDPKQERLRRLAKMLQAKQQQKKRKPRASLNSL